MIAIILAFVAGMFIKEIFKLVFSMLINWFQNRSALKETDRDNIGFTLQNKLASGKYKTVQGVFNTRENRVIDGRKMVSNQVDSSIEQLHKDEPLVIYN